MEISFVITRADLLAPKKEQVDSMMPYFRDVLRTALGRVATDVRLGNLRCVSAKRAWWTKELKEDIWERGGAGWMVGKVNVGKSQLFHEVYPKGRRAKVTVGKPIMVGKAVKIPETMPSWKETEMRSLTLESTEDLRAQMAEDIGADEMEEFDDTSLLPPPQVEVDYPAMPLISALPGTTASPIRVPFGNGKGELIDLPGLSRGELELHVQPEHRSSLVMRSRVRPEQKSIKAGQSLLLGGFIRITPTTPDLIFLAYSFNPLKPHLTSTEKAIGTQTETRESTVENIALPGTGEKIKSAGTFHLKWDVTKVRTGPVTRHDAGRVAVERLPYRVMAADILIEGCGWIEIVAQVRKYRPVQRVTSPVSDMPSGGNEIPLDASSWGWGRRDPEREVQETALAAALKEDGEQEQDIDPDWPAVEVFTPNGRFVASRQPMNAWVLCAHKPSEKNMKGRPRRSMKGMKKLEKTRAREPSM